MYYRIKVSSREDATQERNYCYQDNSPLTDEGWIEIAASLLTPYKVTVKRTHKPKKHIKVRSWKSIEDALRNLKFYGEKPYQVKDWITVATFYKQPCNIEVSDFMGITYTFFKEPNKYTTSIEKTLIDCNILYRISKNGDPFTWEEYAFTLNPQGHCDLIKLVGTHTEKTKEELYR